MHGEASLQAPLRSEVQSRGCQAVPLLLVGCFAGSEKLLFAPGRRVVQRVASCPLPTEISQVSTNKSAFLLLMLRSRSPALGGFIFYRNVAPPYKERAGHSFLNRESGNLGFPFRLCADHSAWMLAFWLVQREADVCVRALFGRWGSRGAGVLCMAKYQAGGLCCATQLYLHLSTTGMFFLEFSGVIPRK